MKRFRQPFFTLLMSVLLLASQQAASVHLLGHLRTPAREAASYQQDHGAADKLAETCTTCIAFAGVGSGALPAGFTISLPAADRGSLSGSLAAVLPAHRGGHYLARAPPTFL